MTNYTWLLSLTAFTTPALSQTTLPPSSNLEVAERSTPGQPAAIIVTGSRISQLGIADSANAGVVTGKQLAARTVYRPGELLEVTPGLSVSERSYSSTARTTTRSRTFFRQSRVRFGHVDQSAEAIFRVLCPKASACPLWRTRPLSQKSHAVCPCFGKSNRGYNRTITALR